MGSSKLLALLYIPIHPQDHSGEVIMNTLILSSTDQKMHLKDEEVHEEKLSHWLVNYASYVLLIKSDSHFLHAFTLALRLSKKKKEKEPAFWHLLKALHAAHTC